MKNLIRAFLLISCVFLLNSFASAETAYPAFKITIQDSNGPWAYTWSYAVENTDGTFFGPWSEANIYSGVTPFVDYTVRTIYPPTNWQDVKYYRVVIQVTRVNTTDTQYGYSAWTDITGLQSGSLQVGVTF
jgi:hypothetical protein